MFVFQSQQSYTCAKKPPQATPCPGNETGAGSQGWRVLSQGHRREEKRENKTAPLGPWRRVCAPLRGLLHLFCSCRKHRVQAIPATTQGARLLLAGMEGHCLHDSFVLKTVEKNFCPTLYVLRASEVSSLVEGSPWELQATSRTGEKSWEWQHYGQFNKYQTKR